MKIREVPQVDLDRLEQVRIALCEMADGNMSLRVALLDATQTMWYLTHRNYPEKETPND